MYIIYNTLLFLAAIVGVPFYLLKIAFTGKYKKSFIQKLGGRQSAILASLKSSRRIWVHAVSVGEVTAAAPIVAALKEKMPAAEIIFSTSTETGQEMAHRIVSGVSAFIYYPLDIPCVVRKMVGLVRPDVFVMVETELWPNFLAACSAEKIKTIMVNGRISPRSYKRYKKTGFFWKRILAKLDYAAMISEVDAERLQNIGMAADKIQVSGNAKYDALAARAIPAVQKEITAAFNVRNDEIFFVAGSTHPGEEEIVIAVYQELRKLYPDLKLIIVPRHIERAREVRNILQKNNLTDIIASSEMRSGKIRQCEQIILVDVIGELFKVYSLAVIVYCGGSLVPRGGQNILEAAAWGRVVFYGPSMEDFTAEKALLEKVGAGVMINNKKELLQGIIDLLAKPGDLASRGAHGKEVVAANMGAATRYAELISKNLP
jgi:3-deoxy-D-manno-octulosonic-acid transferase